MATKAVCCGEESVVVSVYVERPRRRVSSSDPTRRHGGNHHHDHHHHHKVGGGCNRKADLLLYSQQLREAARSRSAGPKPDQHPQLATIHPHTTKIITVESKRKNLRTTTCLGDWKKVLIPSFIKSWVGTQGKKERRKKQHHSGSAAVKMNAIFKRLDVQKKWVSITQLFSTLKKRR